MGEIERRERLEDMIDRYQDLIFSICFRMTSDYFAAQDLTQDTFLAAYRHMEQIEPGHEKGWLARTASNRCIDHLRSAERRSIPTEPELMAVHEGREDVEAEVIERDLREELERNCRRLKEPYAEVAYRYYCREETAEEIAAALGEKLPTVRTRIYRARDQLREIYRGTEERRARDG